MEQLTTPWLLMLHEPPEVVTPTGCPGVLAWNDEDLVSGPLLVTRVIMWLWLPFSEVELLVVAIPFWVDISTLVANLAATWFAASTAILCGDVLKAGFANWNDVAFIAAWIPLAVRLA